MNKLIFGPSGRSNDQIEQKVELEQIPSILSSMGLFAFEYSFGRGVKMSDAKAAALKRECERCGILLSVHAPYYINLANQNPEMIEKTYGYFVDCLKVMPKMGANRLVFHPGALMGQTREEALALAKANLLAIISRLKINNLIPSGTYLCPETMGKHGQLGTPEEVAELCTLDPCLIPTIDFGHVNAFTLGGLKTVADFENVLKVFGSKVQNGNLHIHFSKIEYTGAGEKQHLNFCDEGEPDYRLMLKAIKNLGLFGRILSESAGEQLADSEEMKNYYEKI